MTTAVDTSVLFDILLPNDKFVEAAEQSLEDASAAGTLVICDVVYAELCIHFREQGDSMVFWKARGFGWSR